jgi:hypothetical protein
MPFSAISCALFDNGSFQKGHKKFPKGAQKPENCALFDNQKFPKRAPIISKEVLRERKEKRTFSLI